MGHRADGGWRLGINIGFDWIYNKYCIFIPVVSILRIFIYYALVT